MNKFNKKIIIIIGIMSLLGAILFSTTKVLAYENAQQQEASFEKSNNLKIASGKFNFKGSSKDTVVLHGVGFDTGDISTINGYVRIKVGRISKTYSFEEIKEKYIN